MPNALPEAAIARFRSDLIDLAGSVPDRLGIAVSGGPDSLALLALGHAAFPGAVHAATVDHGLRPEAADEAAGVAAICAARDIPHETLILQGPPHGNVQGWARQHRYAALDAWAESQHLPFLLTAHHADDQLETLIMRINRGSGLGGLAGIRPRNGKILRPLLAWRRKELQRIVDAAGLVAFDDPGNQDDRFDRARLRKALAQADWLDPVAATRSAALLAEAEVALEWCAESWFARRVAERNGVHSLDPGGLPGELLRRLTLRCLRAVNPEARPRGSELDRLIAGLHEDRVATLAGVRCTGGTFWLFAPSPPRRKN